MEQYLKGLFSEIVEKLDLKENLTWITIKRFTAELCNELNLPNLKNSQIQDVNEHFARMKKQNVKNFVLSETDQQSNLGFIYDIIINQNIMMLTMLLQKKFVKLRSMGNKYINNKQFSKIIAYFCKTMKKKECSYDTIKLLKRIVDINHDNKYQINEVVKAIPLINSVMCFREIQTGMEYRDELKNYVSKKFLSYNDINRLCQYILPTSSKYFLKTFNMNDQTDKDYAIVDWSNKKNDDEQEISDNDDSQNGANDSNGLFRKASTKFVDLLNHNREESLEGHSTKINKIKEVLVNLSHDHFKAKEPSIDSPRSVSRRRGLFSNQKDDVSQGNKAIREVNKMHDITKESSFYKAKINEEKKPVIKTRNSVFNFQKSITNVKDNDEPTNSKVVEPLNVRDCGFDMTYKAIKNQTKDSEEDIYLRKNFNFSQIKSLTNLISKEIKSLGKIIENYLIVMQNFERYLQNRQNEWRHRQTIDEVDNLNTADIEDRTKCIEILEFIKNLLNNKDMKYFIHKMFEKDTFKSPDCENPIKLLTSSNIFNGNNRNKLDLNLSPKQKILFPNTPKLQRRSNIDSICMLNRLGNAFIKTPAKHQSQLVVDSTQNTSLTKSEILFSKNGTSRVEESTPRMRVSQINDTPLNKRMSQINENSLQNRTSQIEVNSLKNYTNQLKESPFSKIKEEQKSSKFTATIDTSNNTLKAPSYDFKTNTTKTLQKQSSFGRSDTNKSNILVSRCSTICDENKNDLNNFSSTKFTNHIDKKRKSKNYAINLESCSTSRNVKISEVNLIPKKRLSTAQEILSDYKEDSCLQEKTHRSKEKNIMQDYNKKSLSPFKQPKNKYLYKNDNKMIRPSNIRKSSNELHENLSQNKNPANKFQNPIENKSQKHDTHLKSCTKSFKINDNAQNSIREFIEKNDGSKKSIATLCKVILTTPKTPSSKLLNNNSYILAETEIKKVSKGYLHKNEGLDNSDSRLQVNDTTLLTDNNKKIQANNMKTVFYIEKDTSKEFLTNLCSNKPYIKKKSSKNLEFMESAVKIKKKPNELEYLKLEGISTLKQV